MPVTKSYTDMMVPENQIKSNKPLVPMQRAKQILDVAHGLGVLDRHLVKQAAFNHHTIFVAFFSTKITLAAHSLLQSGSAPKLSMFFKGAAIFACCHKVNLQSGCLMGLAYPVTILCSTRGQNPNSLPSFENTPAYCSKRLDC